MPMLLSMCFIGTILGLFYFGGLWLTLTMVNKNRLWGLWLGASFLLRSTLTVMAIWFFAGGDWQRIVALATGFTIIRFLSINRIKHVSLPVS